MYEFLSSSEKISIALITSITAIIVAILTGLIQYYNNWKNNKKIEALKYDYSLQIEKAKQNLELSKEFRRARIEYVNQTLVYIYNLRLTAESVEIMVYSDESVDETIRWFKKFRDHYIQTVSMSNQLPDMFRTHTHNLTELINRLIMVHHVNRGDREEQKNDLHPIVAAIVKQVGGFEEYLRLLSKEEFKAIGLDV